MAIERAETIARMRKAFRGGISASRFFINERAAGRPLYRRATMLADWRSINQLETKANLLQFVRKDYYPTEKVIASVSWNMSKEYMYVVKVKTQLRPEEPVIDHMINIQSDVPLTPEEIELKVIEERSIEEQYSGETLYKVTPWTAVRRVTE